MRAAHDIASFDSASSMFYALGSYLHGRGHANLGLAPAGAAPVLARAADLLNRLPWRGREGVYIASGGNEALPPRKLANIDSEKLAGMAVEQYPPGRYPAVAVGASNGAMIHLCAALGVPWLPQTTLLPVRRTGVDPFQPQQELEWSLEHGRALVAANPDLQLHNMLDPVQDLLMSQVLSYFRVKRLRLGSTYEQFLLENLEPGGTILLVDCRLKWPTTRVDDRFYFQFGALGGADTSEFFKGGPRIREYLHRHGSSQDAFNPPAPDGESPEAEWGLEPRFAEDVHRFARRYGYAVKTVTYERPDKLSPLVADLYRWWYRRRGIRPTRLLAQTFMLIEPYWTARVGAVPFWMVFSTEPFDSELEQYIQTAGPFDEIGVILFAHGVNSVGLVGADRWQSLADNALWRGGLIGVDAGKFPLDMSVMMRYHTDIRKFFKARYALPGPLSLTDLDTFLDEHPDRYEVQWETTGW